MDEKASEMAAIGNVRHPDINNPKWRNMPDERRCRGHKRNGARCQRPAILGGTVCKHHGGASGHIKRAAKARLENAADRLARQLLGMAMDDDLPPAVKLAAIKDALDRAGLAPRQAVDIAHSLKKYEQALEGIDHSSFSDAPTVVDGEVVAAEWGDFDDGREI